MKKKAFSKKVLESIRESKLIGVRAGREPHRFIKIWAVVVNDRVFVRSWSIKARSWYRTFINDPYGWILVNEKEIAIRATQVRGERLKDAIDRAYLNKYNTPGWIRYAKDLARAKSRKTTTELNPI
jgi:hypothetical protein